MIFIGTVERLDEVPWDEQKPAFHLQKPNKEEESVIKNLSKPHVYYVGTRRGCSYDFIAYSNVPEEEYRSERLTLASVIENQLRKGNEVEVYCCWAGDYDADLEEKTNILFEPDLKGFYIDEKELIVYSGIM